MDGAAVHQLVSSTTMPQPVRRYALNPSSAPSCFDNSPNLNPAVVNSLPTAKHYVGAGIVKYQNQEITLERLAQRVGLSEAEVLEIAEMETLLPPPSAVSGVKYSGADRN